MTNNHAKSARVLLLDDENEFVDRCAKALQHEYQVVKTSSPFEAISFLDAGRQMIDLVVCDFIMPGMNGVEFVRELRKIGVKVPVVLITGAAINPSDVQYSDFVKVLEKPFSHEKLLAEIGQLLPSSQKGGKTDSLTPLMPAIDTVILGLERYLVEHTKAPLESLSPAHSLKIHHDSETHDAFMAWHHLCSLRRSR